MITLISVLIIFVCLTAAYLYWALSKQSLLAEQNLQSNINRLAYEEQKEFLAQQLAQQEITQELYDTNLSAAQRELLVSHDINEKKLRPLTWQKKLAIALTIVMPIVVVIFYWQQGSLQQYSAYQKDIQQKTLAQEAMKELGTPQQVITKLKERLTSNSQDSRGWYLLGRLYFSQQQYPLAAEAFAKANTLKPHQVDTLIPYAETLLLNQQHAQAEKILQEVLTLVPNDPSALNLEALIAYRNKNYSKAISIWQALLAEIPADSPTANSLATAISDAEQRMQSKDTNTPQILLKVKVTLTEQLKKQLQQNDVLFVYAKAAQGPAMPLAIARRPASGTWPKEIILDEQLSMTPSLTLSQFKNVIIYARISHSGQALPEAGDFIGESETLTLHNGSQGISIIINNKVSKT